MRFKYLSLLLRDCRPIVKDFEIKRFLDVIWNVYGLHYNGIQLSTLTHEVGSPWYKVWNERGGKNSKAVSIPNDLIKEYYKDKIKSAQTIKPNESAN